MIYPDKEEYFKYLIDEYSDIIYRLAMSRTKSKEESEDIYQEVFLRLSKKIPEFENKEHEKAWIIRVTINCTKNTIQSKFLKYKNEYEDERIVVLQEEDDVYFAVLELPLKYRTVIYLFYYEGYKIQEISKILHIKENTIKSHLVRARERLKMKIKGGFEDE